MAEFTVNQSEAQAPDYTGASRGIQTSSNTALGNLFSNVADVFEKGVNEKDRHIKKKIEDDIFDEYDAAQAEFGVPEATDLQEDADASSFATSPAGVRRAATQLARLQAAYEGNALKESHYWARMNSMVRQLRGKYPGYRAEIDQMVASVTGAKPANALRAALFQEWDEATRGKNPHADLEDWAIKNGVLPADYFDRQGTDNPYTLNELKSHVARKQRDEAETQARRASMAEAADRNALNERDVKHSFRTETSQTVRSILQDANSAAGESYASLQESIRRAQKAAASGQPLDQTEVDRMRGMMGELKVQVRQALMETAQTSWDGNPSHSYSTQLTSEELNNTINQAMVPIQILEQALDSKEPWGVLGAMSAWLDASKQDASKDLIEDLPFASVLSASQDLFGADVTSLILTLNPEIQASVTKSIVDSQKIKASLGQGSITETFDTLERKEQGPEAYNAMINQWTKLIDQVGKDTLPAEVFANNVRFMFGPGAQGILGKLTDSSRYEYFNKVASPAVSRKMLELKKTDPESWGMYQRWVANNFQILFQDKVRGLQTMSTTGLTGGIPDVEWNEKTRSFKLSVRPSGALTEEGRKRMERELSVETDRLNAVIRAVAPIVDENGGDTGQEVLALLRTMGFDETAEGQNLIGLLMDAIEPLFQALED